MRRYFRDTETGDWYEGVHELDGEFRSDGQADADAIAEAQGWPSGRVEPITLDDADPDPRDASRFADPPPAEPPPERPPSLAQRLADLEAEVEALKAARA